MGAGDEAATGAAYDRVAQVYASHFRRTEPEQPIDLAMIDHFVAGLLDAPVVLDGGRGAGRMSRYLADRGCRVEGIDLSPGMVEMARRVLRPRGSLLVAFQTGRGTQVVGQGLRRFGLEVTMNRYHRTPGQLSAVRAEHGFVERARMVRATMGVESDGQAVLVAGTVGAEPPVAAAPPGPESAR